MQLSRPSLMLLVVEAAAIFSSVLLAFWVEEWREDRRDIRAMSEALAAIETELTTNLEELERSAAYYVDAMPQTSALVARYEAENVFPAPEDIPALQHPVLTTVAYEIVQQNGALSRLDTSDLILIARAYGALHDVDENDASLANRNAQIRYRDGLQYLSGRIFYFSGAMPDVDEAIDAVNAALVVVRERS